MPYCSERMYRSFAASNFQIRESEGEEQSYVVEGYASTFEEPYALWDDVYEVIDRHAFDGSDFSDVIFQENHEGSPLARTRNNSLAVSVDDHGLFVHADLGGSKRGRELYEAITNGLIDQMSFGFIIEEGGFEWDDETRTSRITSIRKVFDVSGVSIPANPTTEIHARDYLNGAIEAAKQQEMLQRAEQQASVERRRRAAMALELAKIR